MLFLEDKTTGVKPADSHVWEQAEVPWELYWGQLQGCKEAQQIDLCPWSEEEQLHRRW